MVRLIASRLLSVIPIGFFIISVTFALFHLVPGDPVILIAGDRATPEVIEALRISYGFDQPLHVQFGKYLSKVLRGDFGTSVYNKEPVLRLVIPRFINTAQLASLSILTAICLSVGLGCIAAMYHRSVVDRMVTGISLVGICTPVFLSGLFAMYLFSVRFRLLPLAGKGSWQAYIMPTLSLAIYQTAFLTRMIRTCMIDALQHDFIRTAKAKGVSESRIVSKHALRNALLPIITVIGLRFGYTLGGTVVTETIFSWPGLGRLIVDSILTRDLPVLQGALLVFGLTFVIINLIVDLLYGLADPRIRS